MKARASIVAVVLLSAGCALQDYHNRMDAQQARIKEFDEINASLEDPIEMPKIQITNPKEEKPAWPFEIFLRLPKGYGTTPKPVDIDPTLKKGPMLELFPMFRYNADADPNYNIFVAAAAIAEMGRKDEFGKYHPPVFRMYVQGWLQEYYLLKHKFPLVVPVKLDSSVEVAKRFQPYPDDAKPIPYQTFQFSDAYLKKIESPTLFRVYFHDDKASARQVAIVTQTPLRPTNEDADKTFRKVFANSLRTLEIGPDAAKQRTQYRRAKG
jgi:hypothetical protein